MLALPSILPPFAYAVTQCTARDLGLVTPMSGGAVPVALPDSSNGFLGALMVCLGGMGFSIYSSLTVRTNTFHAVQHEGGSGGMQVRMGDALSNRDCGCMVAWRAVEVRSRGGTDGMQKRAPVLEL